MLAKWLYEERKQWLGYLQTTVFTSNTFRSLNLDGVNKIKCIDWQQ